MLKSRAGPVPCSGPPADITLGNGIEADPGLDPVTGPGLVQGGGAIAATLSEAPMCS